MLLASLERECEQSKNESKSKCLFMLMYIKSNIYKYI